MFAPVAVRTKPIIDQFKQLGVDSALINAQLPSVTWPSLPAGERRRCWGQVLQTIVREYDVPAFPIRLGARFPVGAIPALELAMKAAPTLRDAFDRHQRFHAVWLAGWILTPRQDERRNILRFEIPPSGRDYVGACHVRELTLAITLQTARRLTGIPIRPRCVEFVHSAPHRTSEHDAFFDAPVRFAGPRDMIEFDLETAALPLPGADSEVSEVVLDYIRVLSERCGREDVPLAERVYHAVFEGIESGGPSMGDIARRIGMSESTLRRRLRVHDLSYGAIVDRLRCDRARDLLVNFQHSLTEIAFAVGFSEPSAFSRAFKRWQGETPSDYRKRFSRCS